MIVIDEEVIKNAGTPSTGRREMIPMTKEEEDLLQHRGVLGMKWGKRKGSSSKSASSPTPKKGVDEHARETQFKKEYSNRDKMSTRSLQNRVKRLQAEQQFKELVNKPGKERAEAAAREAEKRKKRNKMLLKTALSIYGNVPLGAYGAKGKKWEELLGPSQGIAKAATGSDFLKNSGTSDDFLDNVLLHYGVNGMHWGSRKGKNISRIVNSTEGKGVKSVATSLAKSVGNSVRHPFISGGVRIKNVTMHPMLSATSSFMMRKKNNQEIRGEVIKKIKTKSIGLDRKRLIKKTKGDVTANKNAYKIALKSGDASKAKQIKSMSKSLKDAHKKSKSYGEGINIAPSIATSKELRNFKKSLRQSSIITHDRYVSKKKSEKTGKWVYTYNKPRMSLFDKDVTEDYEHHDSKENYDKTKGFGETLAYNNNKISDKDTDRSKSRLTSYNNRVEGDKVNTTGRFTVRKKGLLHKMFDGTLSSIAKLFK